MYLDSMEKLVNLCKNRGFIYPGSEIYGGLANTWDYGPLGVELKNNIKKIWWKKFIQENRNSYGIDASILMNPNVWKASGHLDSFSDPLIDCKDCKTRYRADKLIETFTKEINPDTLNDEELYNYIVKNEIPCPNCGKVNYTKIRDFGLMIETKRGVIKENADTIYLRPETAQGEFVNFLNVLRTAREKIPFGIGQIGKAFRNEITPGNFTFRTIEFEQMEHQWFCKEGTDTEYYKEYKQKQMDFITNIGIKKENLRFKDHEKLAHYAKEACDIQFKYPHGWDELCGTHNRTNYDLSRHQEYSGKSMEYLDVETSKKFIPYVIEASMGCDRLALAILCDAYEEQEIGEGDIRTVLHLHPSVAPYKAAILPLSKKLSSAGEEIYVKLSKKFMCEYDETASIGKRYRRQDEIGTPYCITIDFETEKDNCVTIRERDTMKQIRVKINELEDWLQEKIEY